MNNAELRELANAFIHSDVVSQFVDDWLLVASHVLSDEVNYGRDLRAVKELLAASQSHRFPSPPVFKKIVGFVCCLTQKGYSYDPRKSQRNRELHDAAWRLSDLIHGFRPESVPFPPTQSRSDSSLSKP